MEELRRLVSSSEQWLMGRALEYARKHEFVKHTSKLAEAWRLSIAGISQSLVEKLSQPETRYEFGPEEDYVSEPDCHFGVEVARRHMSRGVSLPMFLGMLKYYRESYLDLVREAGFDATRCQRYCHAVGRFFDRMELGVGVQWCQVEADKRVQQIQASHREVNDEKNRYLTLFESLNNPVILLDLEQRITNLNQAAAELLDLSEIPGAAYYSGQHAQKHFSWMAEELRVFAAQEEKEHSFSKDLSTSQGVRHFQVRLKRMLDCSDKSTEIVVVLNDVTDRKRLENMLRALSSEDPLTRVLTWRTFKRFAEKFLTLAERHNLHGLLLMLRADNAYEILEKHGRAECDRVIAALASILRETVRRTDLLARYQENVFGVLAISSGPMDEESILTRLRQKLLAQNGHNGLGLRLSISSSNFHPSQPCTLEDLLMRAEDQTCRTCLQCVVH